MVILFIRRDGHLGYHEVFHQDVIQIGRAASNDLVLDHFRIDAHHATLFANDGMFAIEWQRTLSRLDVRRTQPPLIAVGDTTFQVKPFVIEVEHYTDPTEIALVCRIESGDDAMRSVYADWLEERDELARAEHLRMQLALREQSPQSVEFAALAERGYALAARVPAGWRSCMAQPAIAIGDHALELGLGVARNARRITGEPYVTLQVTIAGDRLPASEMFVPRLASDLRSAVDLLMQFPELGHPLIELPGVEVLVHREADQAVITARRGDVLSETRLPIRELRARIRRLIEIVASPESAL
jgi:uncharacterized protein (TIGR02996 family)